MKVLHVIQSLDPNLGGLPTALKGLIALENEIQVNHDILSSHSNFEEADFYNTGFFLFKKSFPKRFNRSKGAIQFLKKNICEYDLLVVHSVWTLIGYASAKIAKENNIPYILWPHGSLDPFDLKKKSILKKLLGPIFIKSLLDYATAICCTSQKEIEKLETYNSDAAINVLPLPIIIDQIEGSRERFRKKYNYQEGDFVLLFISRINYKKGLNIIVEGFSRIHEEFPFLKLFIAGSGDKDYLNKLHSWIKFYNLQNKVIYSGMVLQQEKADAFLGGDLFVLPSMNENFGLAIFEALYYGLPVLISKNVYLWQDIVENGGGLACDYSVESFCEKIKEFLYDRNEYLRMKKKSTMLAKEYLPTNLASNYKLFYSKILTHNMK
ncbi:MAG: glycosyltransferase [Elusimicrobiota bacterium]